MKTMAEFGILSAARFFVLLLLTSLFESKSFGQALETSDTGLANGATTSLTYTAPGVSTQYLPVPSKTDPKTVLWHFGPDPYAVKTGTGSIKMTYGGDGTFTTQVDLSGLDPKAHVAGYPFLQYGGSCFGDTPCQQPPHFPVQLSKMSSLMIEVEYDLSGTLNGTGNVLFDQWLVPTEGYSKGQKGSVEVEIMPFYKGASRWGDFKKNVTVPAILNGETTTVTFAMCVGNAGEWQIVLFYPAKGSDGMKSGDLKFDALPLHVEAAAQAGAGKVWFVPGVTIGNEFGDSTSQNFTFKLKKFGIEQTMAP